MQPFPATGTKFQVGEGTSPFWPPSGRELNFSPGGGGGPFLVANMSTQPTVTFSNPASVPRPGAQLVQRFRNYDIAHDGQHFLIVVDANDGVSGVPSGTRIKVVTNWFEELKQRVPAK